MKEYTLEELQKIVINSDLFCYKHLSYKDSDDSYKRDLFNNFRSSGARAMKEINRRVKNNEIY